MIYSRTQILQKEVFFIDVIDNVPQEKLMHLNGFAANVRIQPLDVRTDKSKPLIRISNSDDKPPAGAARLRPVQMH